MKDGAGGRLMRGLDIGTNSSFNRSLANRVFVEVHLGRIVIAALLFVVASPYIIRKVDLLFRIDVFGETTFAVAVRACVPGADTFVWF